METMTEREILTRLLEKLAHAKDTLEVNFAACEALGALDPAGPYGEEVAA